MKVTTYYSKFLDVVEKFSRAVLMVFFMAMTGVAIVEVVRRYFFGLSFVWADEICRYLMIWCTFIGASLAFRKERLVAFDLGQDKLSKFQLFTMKTLAKILALAFIAFIAACSWSFTFSRVNLHQVAVASKVPMYMVYFSVPLGFFIMFLFGIEHLLGLVKSFKEVGQDG